MRKLVTGVLMAVVLTLGVFAGAAAAANGDGNANGGKDKGGTNTCQPSFHEEGGTCVHNGDAGGNCGQNQSGDTGNGNGSNEGNGGDKGYGNRDACDTPATVPPPGPPAPPVAPPPGAPPVPAAETPAGPPATPVAPETRQAPAPVQHVSAARGVFKAPAVKHHKHKMKKHHKAHHAVKGASALLKIAKAPRQAPFTK